MDKLRKIFKRYNITINQKMSICEKYFILKIIDFLYLHTNKETLLALVEEIYDNADNIYNEEN